jgi:hypothetical protein
MPYVTAGGVLVNARDDLTVNVGGASANFQPLSNTTLGWTAGAGVDVAIAASPATSRSNCERAENLKVVCKEFS